MKNISELESSLKKLLLILKKNRENVPLEILRTQYKQPYEELLKQVEQAATAYVKAVLIKELVINPEVSIEEQCSVINQTIQDSGKLEQMGICILETYNTEELYQLALLLRNQIEAALWPYVNLQTCVILDLYDSTIAPIIYNPLIRKTFENGKWVERIPDTFGKLLVYSNVQISSETCFVQQYSN